MGFQINGLEDFTFSNQDSKELIASIVSGRLPFPRHKNAICLWGTYGTGKTTLAQRLPAYLEAAGNLQPSNRSGRLFDSSNYWHTTPCGQGSNGAAVVQGIADRAKTDVFLSPSGYFYEILDEVDLLTTAAQASLKSAMTFANSTIFILTTNNLDKLDRGVRDRAYLVEMNQPSVDDMAEMGRRFLRQMQLTGSELADEKLNDLARLSRGSIRELASAIEVTGLELGGVLVN